MPTAIVTGASRGIGAAVVTELATAGYDVVATARSGDLLRQVAASLGGAPGRVHTVEADATDDQALEEVVAQALGQFGSIDALVNNAGVLPAARPISEPNSGLWEQTLALNLRSPWLLSTLAHPHLKEAGGGAIVNLVSTAGLRPELGLGIYGISKAGLVMLTKVCAMEWARDGIRVNAVAPGLTDTDMAVPIAAYLESKSKAPTLLGQMIQPEEVARVVHFLVDERGQNMTGGVINIDGGHTL
jgi:NAD(P)-dependent dehydrogenase (short-subunit alcohol dehydrogenase family)